MYKYEYETVSYTLDGWGPLGGNDYQIVAIDPEGELEEMAALYDGNFIDLGKGGEFGMINPLEIVIDADEEEIRQGLGYTVLTKSLQFLKALAPIYFRPAGNFT